MSKRSDDNAYLLLAIASAFFFSLLTFLYTTGAPNLKDGAQNTRAAYHLVHAGVISISKKETEAPAPQMRREPLPIVATAAFLMLHPAFNKPYTIADLQDGSLTETVKGVNAFWRFLAALFVFLLCLELFSSWRVAGAMAAICLLISEFFFFARPGIVDRMYTELPEVALMLIASWCAVRFVRHRTKPLAISLGVALGLLVLVKAYFIYVGLGFIVLLLVTDRPKNFQSSRGKSTWGGLLSKYAMIVGVMLVTVAPWLARNAVEFGKLQIVSGTDASVLAIRMFLMEQPLFGGLYMYSPNFLRKRVVGPLTGYTDKDLGPGGRLNKLATAKEKSSLTLAERMQAKGYQGDKSDWARRAALNYAAHNPLRYAASTGVFAYKGIWFMTLAGVIPNILAILCFFGVFFGALITRDQVLIAAFGLPAGLFFFISIFTHALTRYNSPMTPFIVLAGLWLLAALAPKAYNRFFRLRNFVGGEPPPRSTPKASSNQGRTKRSLFNNSPSAASSG